MSAVSTTSAGGQPASNAFDDDAGTYWQSSAAASTIQHCGVDFGSGNEKEIRWLSVKVGVGARAPGSSAQGTGLYYSDDGISWTLLEAFTITGSGNSQEFTVSVSSPGVKRFWSLGQYLVTQDVQAYDIQFSTNAGGAVDISAQAKVTRVDTHQELDNTGTLVDVSETVTVTPARFVSVSTDFRQYGLQAGDTISVSGFSNAVNNGQFTITSLSQREISVSSSTIADESAGQVITMLTQRTGVASLSVTASSDQPVRRSYRFIPFQGKGQYEVRVTRTTANTSESRRRDSFAITGLRSIEYASPVTMTGITLLALRIKATGQLNGIIDELSAVVEPKYPIWDGAAWTAPQVTRNPAWAYVDVLKGSGTKNPVADSRIDLVGLKAWADACGAAAQDGLPYWTFDHVVDYTTTSFRLLKDIAAAGRASFSMKDGKFSVVRDVEQSVPIQLFSPRNSNSFKGLKDFYRLPHALRVRYISPEKDWQQDEITVYDEGYSSTNATVFEELSLLGCTRKGQAWREGRYNIAVGRLRPERFEITVDIEHLIATRGDRVELVHDVPLAGGTAGRIKEITLDIDGKCTDIVIDEYVTMETGNDYVCKIRLNTGAFTTGYVVLNVGTVNALAFSPAIPAVDVPSVGDLLAFGVSSIETLSCLVTRIEPAPELAARILLVPYHTGVYSADTGTIPQYIPNLNRQTNTIAPGTVNNLTYGITYKAKPGGYGIYADISFTPSSSGLGKAYELYELRDGAWVFIDTKASGPFSVGPLVKNSSTTYAVVAVSAFGAKLPPGSASSVVIFATPQTVPNVSEFDVNVINDQAYFSWSDDAVAEKAGIIGYWSLRYSTVSVGATWGEAQPVVTMISYPTRSVNVPALNGTYLIKAFDSDGLESASSTSVVVSSVGIFGTNLVESIVEEPTFNGVKTNTEVVSSTLRLSTGLLDSLAGLFDSGTGLFDSGSNSYEASGEYVFDVSGVGYVDLTEVYISRVTANVAYTVENGATLFEDLSGNFDDSPGLFDEGGLSANADVTLYISVTDDDPSGTPTWSAYAPFVVGDYRGRGFRFKAIFSSDVSLVTPAVSQLQVTIDMPDRLSSEYNLTSSAGGSNISYSPAFKNRPSLVIDASNMATGDYYEITSQTASGFTIQFKNAGGSGIVRTFDYHAHGFGRVQV
jgi:hypothetical protein